MADKVLELLKKRAGVAETPAAAASSDGVKDLLERRAKGETYTPELPSVNDSLPEPQEKRPSYLSYLTPEVSEKVQEVARAKEIEKSTPLRSGAAGLYSKYAMESGSEIVQGTRAGLERGKLEKEKAHADEMIGL